MFTLDKENLHIINVGASAFAESIKMAGGDVLQLNWAPPALGDAKAAKKLATLINLEKVEEANTEAYGRYLSSQPKLQGMKYAAEALPGLGGRFLLHAGPPIEWERMCGPMQGAMIGAILFEEWAENPEAARALAESGEIYMAPCHTHGAVGPMSGVISPSMPVWIVEDAVHGHHALSNVNEGLGKVLRFGAYSDDVLERLSWMRDVLKPVLSRAMDHIGGIELKPLIAQALHMGDEVHNRNAAATMLLAKQLVPAVLETSTTYREVIDAIKFMAKNDHFFLNVSMAACKVMLDAAHGVEGSSMVTAMSRNGVEFGIRLSGTGDKWFTRKAPVVDGLFFPNYGPEDAAPDLGDSSITETAGLGGFAMAAAPAIVQFVGGTSKQAIANTLEMTHITMGRNDAFTLPALNFTGTPAGIDARKVVDRQILPLINTGIAHRNAGIGQIGAGITRAPMGCFVDAVNMLANQANE